MWRKSISLVAVLIISIACGSFGNPTPAPQQNQPSQGNADSSSNSNNPSDENKIIILDNLETTPPSDIIQEIAFFGGMGGGCGLQMCVCEMTPNISLGLFADEETVEIMNIIEFQVCGVQENEIATVTVEIPNQTAENFTIKSTSFIGEFSGYMMKFEYIPDLSTPPGNYHFIFTGDGWEFDKFINVTDANGPRLYRENKNQLIFYNFQPNETVRLFAYKYGELSGWKELTIAGNGNLSLQTSIDADFIAVGDISGQVFDQEKGEYISKWAWLGGPTDIFCNGIQSQITPTKNVEASINDLPIYSYDYETDTFTKIGTSNIEKGTILKISSNPICNEGSFYWFVCLDNKCNYIPEADNQLTYLQPTTRQPEEIPPAQANIPACPGTLPSRLFVGANAEVTTSGMAPQLSLRAQPSMSAEKVHVIAAGRDMVILDGPVCAENSYWWYIRSEQGFEGWSREGDNEDYWIDPLP